MKKATILFFVFLFFPVFIQAQQLENDKVLAYLRLSFDADLPPEKFYHPEIPLTPISSNDSIDLVDKKVENILYFLLSMNKTLENELTKGPIQGPLPSAKLTEFYSGLEKMGVEKKDSQQMLGYPASDSLLLIGITANNTPALRGCANKVISLYEKKADEFRMSPAFKELKEKKQGPPHSPGPHLNRYITLADVGLAHIILAEIHKKEKNFEAAKKLLQKVVQDYEDVLYGDVGGGLTNLAERAKNILSSLEKGGDENSEDWEGDFEDFNF